MKTVLINLFPFFQRVSLTDLERFKVSKAKQARNKLIRSAFFSIRKKGTKTYDKTRKRIEKLRAKSKAYTKANPKDKSKPKTKQVRKGKKNVKSAKVPKVAKTAQPPKA